MDINLLVKILTDMGYNVRGYDDTALYIIDPSCIVTGFTTFLEYAWVILVAISGFMLMGWGFAMIRGAKNDIFKNLRNLGLIFGIVGATIPIVSFIWGNDIEANACETITIPIDRVNEILNIENTKKMSTYNEFGQFERIDIYDSGGIY